MVGCQDPGWWVVKIQDGVLLGPRMVCCQDPRWRVVRTQDGVLSGPVALVTSTLLSAI